MRFSGTAILGAAAACALAGCFSSATSRADLEAACASSVERRMLPRTAEFLEALAARHVGRERQLARLEAAEKEDFGSYGAKDDPRFAWALEVECWALLTLLPPPIPAKSPEERVAPVVKKLLEFEQAVLWAEMEEFRALPPDDPKREACLLALVLTTGWSKERIDRFDRGSLRRPDAAALKPSGSSGDPGRAVLKASREVLALASQVPVPEADVVRGKLDDLRRARTALAEHYLAAAERKLGDAPDASALAKWRIARARYDLEKFPVGL